MHLSDLAIRALPFPDSGQRDYTDDAIPGLTLRVGRRTKTFMLLLGSGAGRKRHTLGRYNPPHFGLADARRRARELIGAHQTAQKEAEPSVTFSDAYDRFMEHYAAKNKASTVKETERLLTRHLKPHADGKDLSDITRRQIVTILDAIASQTERRHFYTAAHTFFRWCRRYDVSNPLEGVEKPPKSLSRSRLLANEELIKVWRATLQCGVYGLLCRVLIVSGQRLGQIAQLQGAHIDRAQKHITWPAELMKTNREFTLPYGPLLHELLPQGDGLLFTTDAGEPFTNWSTAHKSLLKVADVPHFTRHDFRRFYSSTHSAIGTPPHVRELLLSHALGSQVSQTYDRYSYLAEKRSAQERYEAHLSELLNAV